MQFTQDEIESLPVILSAPRFATYLAAKDGDKIAALSLYKWNLDLSAAFYAPLQICEVSVRNSIVKAIEATYGANWPWDKGFEISLPNPPNSFSPRRELLVLRHLPTAGKIVAELKFIFWEKMLTRSHDAAIWNKHFRSAFPYADQAKTVQAVRREGHSALASIRDLRNRIAHHEPIFTRDAVAEYCRIRSVIAWTSLVAATWMDKNEMISSLVGSRP